MDFIVEDQHFSFDDTKWVVLKYDDETAYRERIHKLSGTAAVDFVGAHSGNLYLIEVKDFREYRIENQKRLTSGELAIESGQKVRDTIAGIIGAYRTSDSQKWDGFAKTLIAINKVVKVVVWVEYDLPSYDKARKKVLAFIQTNVYKQKLSWLTSQVLIANQANNAVPDLVVRNLPRLPQS
ncbi:MAG: hypothetical protein WA821_09875 [Anaerolineales bacterium]